MANTTTLIARSTAGIGKAVSEAFAPLGYRFGFNGQHKDNEIAGVGNNLDFQFRMYDSRLGRFFSVDPVTKAYSILTPYQFAGNTPIRATDLDGLEHDSTYFYRLIWRDLGLSTGTAKEIEKRTEVYIFKIALQQ